MPYTHFKYVNCSIVSKNGLDNEIKKRIKLPDIIKVSFSKNKDLNLLVTYGMDGKIVCPIKRHYKSPTAHLCQVYE